MKRIYTSFTINKIFNYFIRIIFKFLVINVNIRKLLKILLKKILNEKFSFIIIFSIYF